MVDLDFLHDITNPLSIAIGNLQRAQRKKDSLSKEDLLEIINISVEEIDRTLKLVVQKNADIQAS